MEDKITLLGDFYFPTKGATLALKQSDDWFLQPKKIASFATNKITCVQAGGNVGYYTKIYSEIFETVYTFEPDPLNFYCLTKNVQAENVIKLQSCLGDTHSLVSLELPPSHAKKGINIGTYQVSGHGVIPTLTVDDLGLESCDLIHLDIEGFEINAINGAKDTIEKFNPVICLEINNALMKFKYSKKDVFDLMESLDYILIDRINEDYIFCREVDET